MTNNKERYQGFMVALRGSMERPIRTNNWTKKIRKNSNNGLKQESGD